VRGTMQVAPMLVEALARRYGVATAGFDAAGIAEEGVLEFVSAVDTVLNDFPGLRLTGIAVEQLPEGEPVRVTIGSETWVTLSLIVARNPRAAGSGRHPVYTRTLAALQTLVINRRKPGPAAGNRR
jgi:hypothetical protein